VGATTGRWKNFLGVGAAAVLLVGCGEEIGEATTAEEYAESVDLPFVDGDVSECVADVFVDSPLSERFLQADMDRQPPPKSELMVGEAVGALAQACWDVPTSGRPTTRQLAAGIYYRYRHEHTTAQIECVAERLAASSLSDEALLARANQLDFTIPDDERDDADAVEEAAVDACAG
jgi:hypothetical protein